MTCFNFTAISLKWKFLAYNLSGLLKRSITSDLRMKKLRIWLCQFNAIRYDFLMKLNFLAYLLYNWWEVLVYIKEISGNSKMVYYSLW